METNGLQIFIQITTAIISLFVCIIAIWGDQIRYKFGLHPKLIIKGCEPNKTLTTSLNGDRIWIWQLIIKNINSSWSVAKNVRLLILSITKTYPDGRREEPQAINGALQITWQFPEFVDKDPDMGPERLCDLGGLPKDSDCFMIFVYQEYKEFIGFVKKDEEIELLVQVYSLYVKSDIYKLKISWDGIWSESFKEQDRHIKIELEKYTVQSGI